MTVITLTMAALCATPPPGRAVRADIPPPGRGKKVDHRVQSSRNRGGSSMPGRAGTGMIVHFAKIREKLLTLLQCIRVVFSHPARVTLSHFLKTDSFAHDIVIMTCIVNE